MGLVKNARTSLVNSARTFRDRLLDKSATTSPDRSATTFQERFATTSLGNSAETCLRKSATTFQEKFATMFPASSASKFPSRSAMPPSQPTEESRMRELKKTRNTEGERRILPEARKRHLKRSSKLPGWSQQSYLFLLCNI